MMAAAAVVAAAVVGGTAAGVTGLPSPIISAKRSGIDGPMATISQVGIDQQDLLTPIVRTPTQGRAGQEGEQLEVNK